MACTPKHTAIRKSKRAFSNYEDGRSACKLRCRNWWISRRSPNHIFELYGPDSRKPGTYAWQCFVSPAPGRAQTWRFIQIYKRGLGSAQRSAGATLALQAKSVDQPSAALVAGSETARTARKTTLVIWGGRIRAAPSIARAKLMETNLRAAITIPRCFTMVDGRRVASKPGTVLGGDRRLLLQHRFRPRSTSTTCKPRFSTALGVDHKRLTFKFQGPALPPDRP